jgi:hypothetical protein
MRRIVNTWRGSDYPGDTPGTGDGNNFLLWLILLGAILWGTAGALVSGTAYAGRKKALTDREVKKWLRNFAKPLLPTDRRRILRLP